MRHAVARVVELGKAGLLLDGSTVSPWQKSIASRLAGAQQ